MFRILFFLMVFSAAAASEPIWQLGKKDNASGEFLIQYFPWEYARIKALPAHPAFDVKSNTFCFKVSGAGVNPSPDMPSGICS